MIWTIDLLKSVSEHMCPHHKLSLTGLFASLAITSSLAFMFNALDYNTGIDA